MNAGRAASGDWLVTRRVPLASPVAADLLSRLAQAASDEQSGILSVSGRSGAAQLKVRYDASLTDYHAVCQRLTKLGATPRDGRWPRWLASWYGWLDANLREGAAAPDAACCNRPPRQRR